MKWIWIVLLASCTQAPETIHGDWFYAKWTDTWGVVTFDSLMTVKVKGVTGQTTFKESSNLLTVDKSIILFPVGEYAMEFFNDEVTLTGPKVIRLMR